MGGDTDLVPLRGFQVTDCRCSSGVNIEEAIVSTTDMFDHGGHFIFDRNHVKHNVQL